MGDMKEKPASAISIAAALLGRVKSKKKAVASRRNGKLGGGQFKKKVVPASDILERPLCRRE